MVDCRYQIRIVGVGGIRLEKKHRKRKDADDLGKRNRVMVGEDRQKGLPTEKKIEGLRSRIKLPYK